jgi:hypothetical protein
LRVVRQLVDRDLLEVRPGGDRAVVQFLSSHLVASKPGHSLVSRLVKGLVTCPEVVELYADDAIIKELIQDQGLER